MNELTAIYVAQDFVKLAEARLPALVKEAWARHWQGDLGGALAAYEKLETFQLNGLERSVRELVQADRVLVAVKVGRSLPNPLPRFDAAIPMAVLAYAAFSHLFWVDHKRAWAALAKMVLSLVRARCFAMLTTPLFLAGHLLSIKGHRYIGHFLAMVVHRRVAAKGTNLPPLARNIALASFPYTLFVTARFKHLDAAVKLARPLVSYDPYYNAIFLVSQLYTHAYCGQVARAEIVADLFAKLHESGQLLRYVPLSYVMRCLPFALRGYGALVWDDIARFLDSFSPQEYDPMINSHVYRAAALIAISVDRHDEAQKLVEAAILYRKKTGAFNAWAPLDERIHGWSQAGEAFNPEKHRLVSGEPVEGSSSLSTLLLRAIATLPLAVEPGFDINETFLKLLIEHVGWHDVVVEKDAEKLDPCMPQIKVGTIYVGFCGLPENRVDYIESMLSSIAPSFRSLADTLGKIRRLQTEIESASAMVAVAQTTQMLAHDVRKPFSIMKIGLDMLTRAAENPSRVVALSGRLRGEISRSLDHVNGMLSDILDASSHQPQRLEQVAIEALIVESLGCVFRYLQNADVTFRYELNHTGELRVDSRQIQRLFVNIIDNARQAMHSKGSITIATRDVAGDLGRLVEISILNSGSFISKEEREIIFNPFFTRGKRNGTGLGLAIAHRFVRSHGGTIRCDSCREKGTSFIFTLPTEAERLAADMWPLPRHSADLQARIEADQKAPSERVSGGHVALGVSQHGGVASVPSPELASHPN